MYEYSKMNLSGTDINVKDSTARESAGTAKTEAVNASGIATEALTTVREHSVKFASLEATTDAQGVDITTLKSQVGTGKLDTAASSLIPAVNEINNVLTNMVKSVSGTTPSTSSELVLDYPTGFTMNKCSVVNVEIYFNGIWRNLSAMAGNPAYQVITSLRENGIYVYPTGNSAMNAAIRITLLRIV